MKLTTAELRLILKELWEKHGIGYAPGEVGRLQAKLSMLLELAMKVEEIQTVPAEVGSIRAGSTVLHKPTGDHWLVAVDVTEDQRVYHCGYPFGGSAGVGECEVLEEPTEELRESTLRTVAMLTGNHFLKARAESMLNQGRYMDHA